jgi:O-antigen/teichoic acid export membrane protein
MSLQGLSRIVQGQMLMSFVRPTLFILLIASAYFLLTQRITPPLAMGMQVAAFGTAFLIGALLLKKYLPKPVKGTFPVFAIGPWVRSTLPLLGIGILGVVNTQADILLLGAIKGAEAVGIYKVALQNALLITFPLVAIKAVSGPTISSLHAKGDRKLLQRIITYATCMAWLGSLPIALGFVVEGKWFLLFLFGREFVEGAMALGILSMGYLINVTMGAVDLVLIMTEHEDMALKGMGFATAFNVILNSVFIPLWGLNGAAIATAISQACWSMILAMWVYRKLKINTTVVKRQIW